MAQSFREMHTLKFANATVYQMQLRQFGCLVPLNARLHMLNVVSLEDDSALEERSMEEVDDLDTL